MRGSWTGGGDVRIKKGSFQSLHSLRGLVNYQSDNIRDSAMVLVYNVNVIEWFEGTMGGFDGVEVVWAKLSVVWLCWVGNDGSMVMVIGIKERGYSISRILRWNGVEGDEGFENLEIWW